MGMHVFKLVYINVLARGRQINCLPRHHTAATAISGECSNQFQRGLRISVGKFG